MLRYKKQKQGRLGTIIFLKNYKFDGAFCQKFLIIKNKGRTECIDNTKI